MKISEKDKLELLLNHKGLSILGIDFAEGEHDPNDIARQIRKALIDISRGNGQDIDLSI